MKTANWCKLQGGTQLKDHLINERQRLSLRTSSSESVWPKRCQTPTVPQIWPAEAAANLWQQDLGYFTCIQIPEILHKIAQLLWIILTTLLKMIEQDAKINWS